MRQRDAFLELLSPVLARSRRAHPVRRVEPATPPMPNGELLVARMFVAPTR